jgi:predicted ArsR family transcriptional regulator
LASVCLFRARGRVGRSSVRSQPAFEGSTRQVRGAVVRALSQHGPMSMRALSRVIGGGSVDAKEATEALTHEGLVERTAAGAFRLKE